MLKTGNYRAVLQYLESIALAVGQIPWASEGFIQSYNSWSSTLQASPEEENPSTCQFSLLCAWDERVLKKNNFWGYVGESRKKAADKGEGRNKMETLK